MQADSGEALREIITAAVKIGASDLHLSVGTPPAVRVSHELKPLPGATFMTAAFINEAVSLLAGLDGREITPEVSEVSFGVSFETGLRLKVNVFYQKGLPAISIRFIPKEIKTIAELGLPPTLKQFTTLRRGLVIIAGPYGSGRSTTVASLIEEINRTRRDYIMTLERPIEHIFISKLSIIEQREVGRDTPSFEQALNYLRHEDVDVLMLSELPSASVIRQVLDVANSGLLVFAEVNAETATGVISKLVNSFEGHEQNLISRLLSEVLSGIIVERLVKETGGGEIPALELLISTDAVRLALREGRIENIDNIIQTSARDGMVTLDRYLLELVKRHRVSLEDALKQAVNPQALEKLLKRAG